MVTPEILNSIYGQTELRPDCVSAAAPRVRLLQLLLLESSAFYYAHTVQRTGYKYVRRSSVTTVVKLPTSVTHRHLKS